MPLQWLDQPIESPQARRLGLRMGMLSRKEMKSLLRNYRANS